MKFAGISFAITILSSFFTGGSVGVVEAADHLRALSSSSSTAEDNDEALVQSEECAPFMEEVGTKLESFYGRFNDKAIINYICNPITRAQALEKNLKAMEKDVANSNNKGSGTIGGGVASTRSSEDPPSCRLAYERLILENMNKPSMKKALKSVGSCKKEMKKELGRIRKKQQKKKKKKKESSGQSTRRGLGHTTSRVLNTGDCGWGCPSTPLPASNCYNCYSNYWW